MPVFLLPQLTPYDPSEDPPGSIDPLGTVTGAEQLAEVLLPGLTARMWRVRLLTFAALAAEVSRRVAAGRDRYLTDARLAFERLYVSAMVRQEESSPDWRNATRRLPGVGLARQALLGGDQPLGRANFLKGQGINGPFGVIARLARDVGIIDESGELNRAGTELLLAWGADQNLPGLLDEGGGRTGADWLKKLVRQVSAYLDDLQSWPKRSWPGWKELADRLRPDRPGNLEIKVIEGLLSSDPLSLRDRMIQNLTRSTTFEIYHSASREGYRGAVEQVVMTRGLSDSRSDDEVGRTLQAVSNLINSYEVLSGLLEGVFRGLIWGLTRHNGQASPEILVQNSMLDDFLSRARTRLGPATNQFQLCLQSFERDSLANKRGSVDIDRMHRLLEDSTAAMRGTNDCLSAVMDRHLRVQKEKHKGVWIEVDKYWTLMPSFGDNSDEPQHFEGYLHPYRITNLYGMLADLRMVTSLGVIDGEENE